MARQFRFSRARIAWSHVRDSLWFLPGTLTVGAAALAFVLVGIDRHVPSGMLPELWFFGGGADGARGVLSAIAGSLITVTGVVFSVTIVALQLASTQFTPRVLRNFTADRANQVVLGVFIATFTYTLLVLRSVASTGEAEEEFVPAIAVSVSVGLVLVSIGFLIFFIHHAARSIQASFIVDRVTQNTLATIAAVLPELREEAAPAAAQHALDHDDAFLIRAQQGGYIQSLDEARLLELIERHGLTVRLQHRIGAYVMAGEALAAVVPGAGAAAHADALRSTVVIGRERTPEQDVEYGLIELADIAVKALSPGINDPTTALLCIDHIGEVLAAWGRRDDVGEVTREIGGVVRLAWPVTPFARAVGLAFDAIVHYGADDRAVLGRVLDVIGRVAALLPAQKRPELARTAARVAALRK